MKNMKNRKNIFQLFFPPDSGPIKAMAPVNFLLKFFFLAPSCKYLDGFCLIYFHLGHFRWPYRLPPLYYITYYIHFLSQNVLTDAQATFT